ncbi:class I SAM-dependent methyltransferase [Pseudodesulfovibrio portus]|uniref:Methyltransferase n=1 Tax=Pseudodesulfovibrio portus TaxID=231439 RepID=A0ABM8AT80_9BACT|nr:class I SAM-dependent methyltransferase [Pseudodesulfovibrio portus]BDQ34714.1 methyltransferase [Pseudodesulfovibrio portus]
MSAHSEIAPFIVPGYNEVVIADNLIAATGREFCDTQEQTADAFSNKWSRFDYEADGFERRVQRQKAWYLKLYGFESEAGLKEYLSGCRFILDAGAGLGYKAAWFAELCPDAIVVAADISASVVNASKQYRHLPNLLFLRCDIGNLDMFADDVFDYVSCDQVIQHTADPHATFRELVRVTKPRRDASVYVYRKKALPRELLDEYFRDACKQYSHEELMELSRQITELGKVLSAVDQEVEIPDIPAFGIEGGKMTVQRFLYWNFMKCFWNEELGEENSLMTNYDWYSPSQAFRYSEEEFRGWIEEAGMDIVHFHKEKACYSGRFKKVE